MLNLKHEKKPVLFSYMGMDMAHAGLCKKGNEQVFLKLNRLNSCQESGHVEICILH